MRSSSFDGSAEDITWKKRTRTREEGVEDVAVDFIGDGLLGPRKWLGAATIIDEKTKETTFYGVRVTREECSRLNRNRTSVRRWPVWVTRFKYF